MLLIKTYDRIVHCSIVPNKVIYVNNHEVEILPRILLSVHCLVKFFSWLSSIFLNKFHLQYYIFNMQKAIMKKEKIYTKNTMYYI